ncbi:MAG: hypothetical protein FJZ64_05045, partial [Chlamydiae bacterium]|nr:hypothetical protein [Chlamydiota bacterium]
DFVLETKWIRIPGYPDAFNPSILRWQGKLLMCFRTYHPETRSTHHIALVHLNEEFEPIDSPRFLQFRSEDIFCLQKRQDPRLVTVENRLFLIYNNSIHDEVRRMLIAEVRQEEDRFIVDSSECLLHFEGEQEIRSEKNWVPFDYEGNLHLAYSILPHKILSPIPGMNACATIASTLASIKWNYGVLRGGTPALLLGEEYLAFFHSCKSMKTQHSQGKTIPHYFIGAYTFSAKPPFAIQKISKEPIVGPLFYHGPAYKTWKPLRVVFPGGYVANENFIWILYGRQDHEIWVVKLDKKGLMESLVKVTQR